MKDREKLRAKIAEKLLLQSANNYEKFHGVEWFFEPDHSNLIKKAIKIADMFLDELYKEPSSEYLDDGIEVHREHFHCNPGVRYEVRQNDEPFCHIIPGDRSEGFYANFEPRISLIAKNSKELKELKKKLLIVEQVINEANKNYKVE